MTDHPRAARWDTATVLALRGADGDRPGRRVPAVTGVVDWDGACPSDGALDLMTLLFDLSHRAPGLAGLVRDRLLAEASEPVRLACWAHMSLRLVDWSIRELDATPVGLWTEVAEQLRATVC